MKHLWFSMLLFGCLSSSLVAKNHNILPLEPSSPAYLYLTPYSQIEDSYLIEEDTSPYTFDKKYEKLIKELAYMQLFAFATIGTIGMLPEGVSHWSKEDKAYVDTMDLLKKHAQHIKQGPVWDKDEWVVNYIGHPVAGSYFYVWGRESGLSWQESSLLSLLMSTFFWEYGWEAFAEVPSKQDLIVTPLLGSLLGEGTYYLYNKIRENHGELYHSKVLGSIAKALLNPIGEMNRYLQGVLERQNVEISVDYAYNHDADTYRIRNIIDNDPMKQSYFKLNFKLKY